MRQRHRPHLTALLAVLIAAGCSTAAPSGQSLADEITVFLISGPSDSAIQALIPDFTAATGIKVKVVEAGYDDAHPQQLLAFQSKRGQYDVVQFDNPFLAPYVAQQALAPLDEFLAKSTEYDNVDFVPALQEYGQVGGVTYGLPLSTEPLILWYRKDIYDALGLQVPTTWDEYRANAEAIQESGKAAGQVIAYASPQTSWWWLQFLWSYGGDLHDDQKNPTVTTPEAVKATEVMKALLASSPDSAISANTDEVTSIFISTDVGQMINYSGFYPVVTDRAQSKVADKVGYAKVPAGTADVIELTGWNIGIPADSKKQAAGQRFLEWILGKTNAKRFLEAGAAAVGRSSTTSDPELLKKFPYLSVLVPSAESGRPLPQLVEWPEIQNAIGTRVADIMTDKQSIEDGLEALQADLTAILK